MVYSFKLCNCVLLLAICVATEASTRPQTGSKAEDSTDFANDLTILNSKQVQHADEESHSEKSTFTDEKLLKGFFDRKRKKRVAPLIAGMIKLGRQATKALLSGAKFLKKEDGVLSYSKYGDYDQAVRDFYSLRPTDVQKSSINDKPSITGVVGDRVIAVANRPSVGIPFIGIMKPSCPCVYYKVFYIGPTLH